MKIGKILSMILIAVGVLFIGIGVWNIVESHMKTGQSLEKAKELLGEPAEAKAPNPKDGNPYKPKFGDAAGILVFPTLEAELPIVEGTSPDDLEKGVGHYKGSYYPEEHGQIVLSGHRDTVFRRTGELKIGDPIKLRLPYGDFTYKIIKTKIVDKDDRSIITLQHEKEELILTTCYPFRYVGNAPKRYIIYAEREAP